MTRLSAALVARTGVVAEPRWSPDGARLGWIQGRGERCDLVVAGAPDAVDHAPVVVTAETGAMPTRSTGGGVWCWVGTTRVAVVDAEERLVLLTVDGGAPPRVLARDGRAGAPAATAAGDRVAFVLERDDACDVAVVDLPDPGGGDGGSEGAWPTRVSHADYAWDPDWSPDGSRLAWHEWDLDAMSWDSSRIVVADMDGPLLQADDAPAAKVVAGGVGVAVGQPRFSPDGSRLAWVTDESGWWNVVVADAGGGTAVPVLPEAAEQAEPSWGLGQRSFAWAPDGRSIALCRNEEGFGRLLAVAVASDGEDQREQELARGWHHGLDWGPDGIVAVRSGARTPPVVCRTEVPDHPRVEARGEPRREELAHAAPADVRAGLVEPEPVTWAADDGTTAHGLLFRPAADDAPPMVVDVHGGPTGQAVAQWKPLHQHLVTSGYAVLAPNPRGSTGYGRPYAQALAGEWGVLDVADCAAGVRAAIGCGWCDARRIVVSGASSGGLAALLLAARHPDLVCAVIAMYPVTDLLELAATTHRFESRYTDWLVGELPEDAPRYGERSPVTHAADLRAPLLLLHGDEDRVVPPEQAAALAAAVRGAGGTVEHHVYRGEGHGFTREDTLLDLYARLDDFLRRCCAPT